MAKLCKYLILPTCFLYLCKPIVYFRVTLLMSLRWIYFRILIFALCASLTCAEQDIWENILGVISALWLLQKEIAFMDGLGWFLVFIATFNNISVISLRSVLLMGETRVPGENHRYVASHWQILSHNILSSKPRLSGIQTLVVICTDCTGNSSTKYHMIQEVYVMLL